MGNRNSNYEHVENHANRIRTISSTYYVQHERDILYQHEVLDIHDNNCLRAFGSNISKPLPDSSMYSIQHLEVKSSLRKEKGEHYKSHNEPMPSPLLCHEQGIMASPVSKPLIEKNGGKTNIGINKCSSPEISSSWDKIKDVISDLVQYSRNKIFKSINEMNDLTTREQKPVTVFEVKSSDKTKSKNALTNPWVTYQPSSIPFPYLISSIKEDAASKLNISQQKVSIIGAVEDEKFTMVGKDNACAIQVEGYDISFGSSDSITLKKFASYNDSGFCSMLNSCSGHLLSEGGESTEDSCHEMEDEEDMMYPCSYDLIAINKLLRINYQQKQRSIKFTNLHQEKQYKKVDNSEGIKTPYTSSANDLLTSAHIHFHEKDPFLEKEFYFNNFDDTQTELKTELSYEEQDELLPPIMNFSMDEKDGLIFNWESSKILGNIQLSLEMNYVELLMQKRKIRDMANRQRAGEKIKRQHLKIFKNESIKNKKLLLLQTLHHLKTCLDQQKTWLQCTYDNILERKWPILHQVKG